MPNWCQNELKIIGKKEDIKKFLEKIKPTLKRKKYINLFSELFPCPKILEKKSPNPKTREEKELIKKYGDDGSGWWNWCVEKWGTKWDIDLEIISENDHELTYETNSAWSPPLEGFTEISKLFPNLTFFINYIEPGMGFMGISKIKNGKIDDHCVDMYQN